MNSRQINLVLGAVVLGLLGTIYFLMSWATDRQNPEVIDRTNYMANTVTQITVKKFNATNLLAALANRTISWRTIESTNYLFYMLNLRSIGCPEETIRDIIIADVAKLYARKRADLIDQMPPFEYWRTKQRTEDDYHSLGADPFRALENEKRELIRDLLQVNYDAEIAKFDPRFEPLVRLQGVFSSETRQQIQDVLNVYDRMAANIRAHGGGLLLPEDEAELRGLELQKREELAQILTEEELQTYDLYTSPLAEEMRRELYGFEPTQEEFVRIFELRKSFDDVLDSTLNASYGLSSRVREEVLAEAEAALNQELGSILGSNRFAEYQRVTDPEYQQLLRLSDRVSMPEGAVDQIYSMRSTAQQQREAVLADPNLSLEQRREALNAISVATQGALSDLMGNEVLTAYRQAGSDWLTELNELPAENTLAVTVDQPRLPPPVPDAGVPRIGDPIPANAPFPFYQPPVVPPPPPLPNPVPQ